LLYIIGRVLIPSHHTPIIPPSDDAFLEGARKVAEKTKELQSEYLQQCDDSMGDEKSIESVGAMIEAVVTARQLIEDSQKKWGKASAAEGVCWDAVIKICVLFD